MNWPSHENKQSCGDFPVDLEHFVTLLQCCFLDIPRLSPANNWDIMRCISESQIVFTSVIICGKRWGGCFNNPSDDHWSWQIQIIQLKFRMTCFVTGVGTCQTWSRKLQLLIHGGLYICSMTYNVTVYSHKWIMIHYTGITIFKLHRFSQWNWGFANQR